MDRKPKFFDIEEIIESKLFTNIPTMSLHKWKKKYPNFTSKELFSLNTNGVETKFRVYKCHTTQCMFIAEIK